jgi:hypothetical protein
MALGAARRGAVGLRENFETFCELVALVAGAAHKEDLASATVMMSIEILAVMTGTIGNDQLEEFVRLWHSLLGGIVDFIQDQEMLTAAALMAQHMIDRFPGQMAEALGRSGGVYQLVYDRLFKQVAESQL